MREDKRDWYSQVDSRVFRRSFLRGSSSSLRIVQVGRTENYRVKEEEYEEEKEVEGTVHGCFSKDTTQDPTHDPEENGGSFGGGFIACHLDINGPKCQGQLSLLR
ncbi:hypothetical protein M0802_007134 [Mischocyttarus mexicanus]|nr:hypothetical protein M0802_007134 [Mischocyttarus mexicanus]